MKKTSTLERIFFTLLMAIVVTTSQVYLIKVRNDMEFSKAYREVGLDIKNLHWLRKNKFINKKGNKYEIIGPKEIGFDHLSLIREKDVPNYEYFKETLHENSEIIKNTYKNCSNTEKFIFNYVMYTLRSQSLEDTKKMNERLEEYYPLLETIEEKGNFYKDYLDLFFVLCLIILINLCVISGIFTFVPTKYITSNYRYNIKNLIVLSIIQIVSICMLPLCWLEIATGVFFVTHILVQKNYIGFGDKIFKKKKIVNTFKGSLK